MTSTADTQACKRYEIFATRVLACVASVSVRFRSKERPIGIFGFDRARNKTKAKKWREGEGKEGNACRQTPRFWKPAFASERSAWLARLFEQYWHVSIKGLFHTERSCMVRDTHINFLWLLFILVGNVLPLFFFLRDVKFSRIVIYRSKFRRMDCTLNWNYIHYGGGLHCDSKYKELFWFHTRVL